MLAVLATTSVLVAIAQGPLAYTGDPENGRRLFERRCTSCHSLETDAFGPRLGGVYGRPAGGVPTFSYSQALRSLKFRWTEAELDVWLAGPRRMAPGAAMPISIGDARQRADLIAFLKRQASGR
ncbi:c-type cytochrome [uncultured Caulobacter sp.]|uniref:c-type cytochrome n=1 Tax=uncultured Caulobacter sp. TaxID=158749 RepID=UPI002616C62B|nr:c-type cytochrome [uncultured Caulobacter sp.]